MTSCRLGSDSSTLHQLSFRFQFSLFPCVVFNWFLLKCNYHDSQSRWWFCGVLGCADSGRLYVRVNTCVSTFFFGAWKRRMRVLFENAPNRDALVEGEKEGARTPGSIARPRIEQRGEPDRLTALPRH